MIEHLPNFFLDIMRHDEPRKLLRRRANRAVSNFRGCKASSRGR